MITAYTKPEFKEKVKEIFKNDYCLFWKEICNRKGLGRSLLFLNVFIEFAIQIQLNLLQKN